MSRQINQPDATPAEEKGPEKDNSLRGQALRRATGREPPRTLTAWEWEQWYAEHGVPKSHQATEPRKGQAGKFFGLLSRVFVRADATASKGE